MDICGPMRVASVNGKKYILLIVDDYSRFIWVKCLRSKDEAPDFIIKFLKMIQQNGVVERRNCTLIEAARTMFIYAKAPLFLWEEAVVTACYTQNRSIVCLRHDKTPFELLHDKLPDLSFFHVFGALCYPTNNSENLDFDELTAMASEHNSSGPVLHEMTPATISLGLVLNPPPSTPFVPPLRIALEPAASTGSPSSTTVDQDARSPISTRLQLHEQVIFYYYDAFLTVVEPKTYKDYLTQSYWIEAMLEDLNEFERLGVWELVPRPDKVMVITLKWIYKVKLDELEDTPMVEKSKLDEDKEGKSVDPSHYHGMIGTLLYLTASRPDLRFAIYMCARYQARPTEKHLHAVKRIFRYLRGTINRGLWYPKDSSIALTAFTDADHAGCQDTRRSTSSSMQFLGDRLVSWSSKSQKSAAISSTEAEYIAMSKHIDIRFHFIKEHVENGVTELYFVNTEYQLADIFTKALGRERIEFLINKLGMRSFTPETLKQLADEVDE
ncbi:retrovirus-related pol polyprotein from transposon TNT 1-94 [Tanacetum coccineum]